MISAIFPARTSKTFLLLHHSCTTKDEKQTKRGPSTEEDFSSNSLRSGTGSRKYTGKIAPEKGGVLATTMQGFVHD